MMHFARSIGITLASRTLRRFGADSAAAVAVEFAILLPLLLTIYLTTFEASQAIDAHQKVTATASTVGNLVSRMQSANKDTIENIFNISGAMMIPFETSKLEMTVTTVRIDDKGNGKVHWSKRWDGAKLQDGFTAGSAYTLPPDMKAKDIKDTYLVVTSASYDHDTLVGYKDRFVGMHFEKFVYFRPRRSTEIAWN